MDKFETLPIYNEANGDVFDVRALHKLVDFQRHNNPALKDMSSVDIAEGSGIGISTYKSLLNGTAKNPRLDTLKRLLRFIGGGSIDVLVCLAPPRDYDREQREYNPTIVDMLNGRIEAKKTHIAELEGLVADLKTNVDMLNGKLEAKKERIAELEGLVAELKTNNKTLHDDYTEACIKLSAERQKNIHYEDYRERVRRMTKWLGVAFIAVLFLSGLSIYLLWELWNPARGFFQF